MDKLPQIKIGDAAPFQFGEIVLRATVWQGHISGLKSEHQIANDTSKDKLLKELMTAAAETMKGRDVLLEIKADKTGPYRVIQTVKDKTKHH